MHQVSIDSVGQANTRDPNIRIGRAHNCQTWRLGKGNVMYLKKILVGAAVFLVSVFLCNLIALSLMWSFPEIGWARFFPENYHTLGWGGYFDFPLWRSWIVGLFICAITFVWMYRKASPRL